MIITSGIHSWVRTVFFIVNLFAFPLYMYNIFLHLSLLQSAAVASGSYSGQEWY